MAVGKNITWKNGKGEALSVGKNIKGKRGIKILKNVVGEEYQIVGNLYTPDFICTLHPWRSPHEACISAQLSRSWSSAKQYML